MLLNDDWLQLTFIYQGQRFVYSRVGARIGDDVSGLEDGGNKRADNQLIRIVADDGRELLVLEALISQDRVQYYQAFIERLAYLFFFLMLILLFFIAWGQSVFVTRPLSKLSRAVSRISEGDFELDLKCCRKDEIGALAKQFSIMSKRLKEHRASLPNEWSEVRNIFDNAQSAIVTVNLVG